MPRARMAVALLAVSLAAAADKDPWILLSSPHFEVLTDAGERSGRDLARHFEQVHSFFFQRFKTGIDPTRKARVLLFRNEKEYEPYRPNQFAAAFFHPGEYRDFIVLHNSGNDWRPTAVHELTHLMVNQLSPDLPLWLNEGLAELYSNMEARGTQMMVGRDIPGRMRVLATEPWIGLPALLAVNHDSAAYNDKSRAGIFYAESWKLVHMLHLHPAYEAHLGDLVRGLLKTDPAAAFQTAYGKDLWAVERDLRDYLNGNTISAMLFNIQMPKSVDTPEIETGASLFAHLAIAELLSNTRGSSEQASEAYAKLAHDYPDRWEVEESAGLFAWHERRMEEAARHFAKAERLGCKKSSMFLLWGRVLGYSNHTRESVAVLSKAVDLEPDSAEAQVAYGDALVRNGNFGAAVATLRAVKSVPAASMWRYWYNLAFGLYRLGDPAAAKTMLANARKHAGNARETSSLDQLEAALDRPVRADAAMAQSIEGMLENLECGEVTRLQVRVGGRLQIFAITDPRGVQSLDLECGVQKSGRRVYIEYVAASGMADVAGVVRMLELR